MSNNTPVGPLVILGDALVGETLTARPNGIKDDDGINYSTTSFQWLRDGEPISGATAQTYSVGASDIGAQIAVRYMYQDNSGNNETVDSKPEPAVPASDGVIAPAPTPSAPVVMTQTANNIDPVGPLVILGDALVGKTLTARPNGIKDDDGINYKSVTFQWLRDGQEIPGATNQTYEVTAADRGAQLSVEYAYVDNGGSYEVVVSKPEPAVPGGTPSPTDAGEDEAPVDPAPPVIPETPDGHINSGPVGNVFILGFPIEGTDLLARLDALYDRDTIIEGTGAFQWLRDGDPIPSATNQVYTVTSEDRGAILSVQYSYTDGGGTRETVVSAPETPVPYPDGMEPETPQDEDTPGTPDAGDETPSDDVDAGTTPEDDVVTITSAMSNVDGLEGEDTAVLAGDQTDYTVTLGQDGVTVTDRSTDGLGTVQLTNFEFLDFDTDLPMFADQMDLTQFAGHTGLGAAEFEAFIEMYIAYFNRAPDAIGLGFWGTAFANGMTMEAIAAEFAIQPETLAAYPASASDIDFVAGVYQNVLGRSPDIDGLRFWTSALDENTVTRGDFILEVLRGAKAAPPSDASEDFVARQLADQIYLETKVDLGAYFAVHRGMSNTDDAATIMALFDGSNESLQSAVSSVDTLFEAAQDAISGDFLLPIIGVLDNPFEI